jgi:hypothetical protein
MNPLPEAPFRMLAPSLPIPRHCHNLLNQILIRRPEEHSVAVDVNGQDKYITPPLQSVNHMLYNRGDVPRDGAEGHVLQHTGGE